MYFIISNTVYWIIFCWKYHIYCIIKIITREKNFMYLNVLLYMSELITQFTGFVIKYSKCIGSAYYFEFFGLNCLGYLYFDFNGIYI